MMAILSRIAIFLAVAFLPLRAAHRIARAVGQQRYAMTTRRRFEQLREAVTARLGLGTDAADALVRIILERSALERLEGGVFRLKSRTQIDHLVEIRGIHELNRALENGHGCILYSGHFCGRWSAIAKFGLLGYNPVFVRQRPPASLGRVSLWFQDRFDRHFSKKFNCRFLWLGGVADQAAAHLRQNGVLVTLVDISAYTSRRVDVDFLNRSEAFPAGPANLAHVTAAPLIGFSIHYSDENARYVCELGPAHMAMDDARATMQQTATWIDRAIRAHPEDWAGWLKNQYLHPASQSAT